MRRFVLLAVLPLACAFDAGDPVVYGTLFDGEHGETVLVWPADRLGERFRAVRFGPRRRLPHQPVVEFAASAPPLGCGAGAVRVLGLAPPPVARAAVAKVAFRVAGHGSGVHVVPADAAWFEVAAAEDADRRLRSLAHATHAVHRRHYGLGRALADAVGPILGFLDPSAVVVVAGEQPLVLTVDEEDGEFVARPAAELPDLAQDAGIVFVIVPSDATAEGTLATMTSIRTMLWVFPVDQPTAEVEADLDRALQAHRGGATAGR